MAGDWIKFEKATLDKPEVYEIAGILGIEADAVIGKLLRVWNWFDDQSRDGNAPVTLTALLDRYAGVTGFVNAMQSVGWMHHVGNELILPKFDRHNGNTAKKRALGKVRAQTSRSRNANSNADGVTKALPEKRREEKSIITLTSNNKARGTMEELKSYAAEIGLPESDGEYMFDHWTANGWKNGSSPSKDWKAGMRKWKAGGYFPSQKGGNAKPLHKGIQEPELITNGF